MPCLFGQRTGPATKHTLPTREAYCHQLHYRWARGSKWLEHGHTVSHRKVRVLGPGTD